MNFNLSGYVISLVFCNTKAADSLMINSNVVRADGYFTILDVQVLIAVMGMKRSIQGPQYKSITFGRVFKH